MKNILLGFALLLLGCSNKPPVLPAPDHGELPVVRIDIEGGREITAKTDEYFAADFTLEDDEFGVESSVGIRGRGMGAFTN